MKNTSALRPLVAVLDGLSTTASDLRDSVLDCASPLALSGEVNDVARPGKSARGLAHSKTWRTFAAALFLFAFILHPSYLIPCAHAQGTAFTYQGLVSFSGAPVTGVYDLSFAAYDALSAGTLQGVTNLFSSLSLTNGRLTATLDFGANVFTGADRFLQMALRTNGGGVFTNLAPRQKLTATPYAITAGALSGSVPAANVIPALGMVWLKPGTFILGSRADEPGRLSIEGPQTVVTLTKGFWMGAHEVTQGEYLKVVGSNPSAFTGDANRPVELVSWNNATNYCRVPTLSERTAGRLPAGWGYRLPTEAEWEYACRTGARTTRFGYGDDVSGAALINYAWYSVNSGNTTHPVEQKLANPWGLMDMHGNVWEWCQDFYDTYPGGSVSDPTGPVTGIDRVLRGGGWGDAAGDCRSAQRLDFNPSVTYIIIGFRVVLSPGQP